MQPMSSAITGVLEAVTPHGSTGASPSETASGRLLTVDESQIDQGGQTGRFTDDGADYTLYYTVEKA